jgi:hypothetical protein
MANKNSENSEKVAKNFYCKTCDYTSSRKHDMDKHLSTHKHARLTKANKTTENSEHVEPHDKYVCKCGSKYKHQASLSKHKHHCKQYNKEVMTKENITAEIVIKMMESNNQLKEFFISQMAEQNKIISSQTKTINEIIPKIGSSNIITTNNNTINNNQKLNINLFLNEQCKDAISMDAFVNSIEVSLPDLIVTKDKGLVEGISNIIIENMSKLPLTQRPIHCTDVKRETIYIKNDTWEKDNDQSKTKEAIKKISGLQIKNLNKWKEANPGYMEDDKLKEEFMYLVKHSTDEIKNEKIIKSVCKKTYINEKLIDND